MNKKEKSEMEALRREVALLRAWRLTEPVEPDVELPNMFSEKPSRGFLIIANGSLQSGRVEKALTRMSSHCWGEGVWEHTDKHSWSQGLCRLYSTKSRALKALRHGIEATCMKRLAELDRQISESEQDERTEKEASA